MISDYVLIYYTVMTLSIILTSFVWTSKHQTASDTGLRFLIILLLSIIYLIGMVRQYGIDYGAYLFAFYEDPSTIKDIGFQILMLLFRSIGLSFEVMMLFIGFFTLYTLKRLAKKFDIGFILLLTLYIAHLAVVRDFAQLRSGLALTIVCFAITLRPKFSRFTTYLIASSIHFTSITFITAYEYGLWVSGFRNRTSQRLYALYSWIGILTIGVFVQTLSFLDPRINLYLNWNQEGYGASVSQFSGLLLPLAVMAVAYLTREVWQNNLQINLLFYLQITGIVTFLSFINYSIFAFRLSNLVLSLYPVLLISVLKQNIDRKNHIHPIIRRFIFVAMGFLLLLRPGTFDIIRAMRFEVLSP